MLIILVGIGVGRWPTGKEGARQGRTRSKPAFERAVCTHAQSVVSLAPSLRVFRLAHRLEGAACCVCVTAACVLLGGGTCQTPGSEFPSLVPGGAGTKTVCYQLAACQCCWSLTQAAGVTADGSTTGYQPGFATLSEMQITQNKPQPSSTSTPPS